jgi:hypothetical protein
MRKLINAIIMLQNTVQEDVDKMHYWYPTHVLSHSVFGIFLSSSSIS